jgi:GNAT superfamily N-acetyltransferase
MEYVISTDPARLDLDVIHKFLSQESYWARGIPRETVVRSFPQSICFGVYAVDDVAQSQQQVGFARVVTDRAVFAYIADVFILSDHRGKGLSKRLMEAVFAHPDLQNLRRWILATADAHGLYRQFGFTSLSKPERLMERHDATVYSRILRSDG